MYFFGTIIIVDPQGEVIGRTTPYYNNCCNYFFTSLAARIYYLYSPIVNNEEYENMYFIHHIALGGIPLIS